MFNPIAFMAQGLVAKTISLIPFDQVIDKATEKVVKKESMDDIVDHIMDIVQPMVDKMEEVVAASKTKLDDAALKAVGVACLALAQVFQNIGEDLTND